MISTIQAPAASVIDTGAARAEFQTLDDRMRDAFAAGSVEAKKISDSIVDMANDPGFLSDPGNLLELQVRLGDYRQQVELISALARKGVGVAETVLRA